MFALYLMSRYFGIKLDLFENFEEVWQMDTLCTSSVQMGFPNLANVPGPAGFYPPYEDSIPLKF